MDTNIKINCNVKLYFNLKKNLHYYRYPLKAEPIGVRINKNGMEVPQYKERRLRSDEYVNRDFYKTFPFHIPGENGKLSHTKERDNRICEEQLEKGRYERQIQLDRGIVPNDNKKGSGDFYEFYEYWIGNEEYSNSTLAGYRSLINKLKLFTKRNDLSFDLIDYEFVRKFEHYMQTTPVSSRGIMTQVSINKRIQDLIYLLWQAHNAKAILVHPVTNWKYKNAESEKKDFLTKDEFLYLKDTKCDYPVIKSYFLFSCLTGLPAQECRNLKWGDVKETESSSVIEYERQKTFAKWTVKIGNDARQLMGKRMGNDDSVFFLLPKGSSLNDKIKKWIKDANINKHITPHCARNTFAAFHYAINKDPFALMKAMGHKDLKTTQRYIDRYLDHYNANIMPSFSM